MSRVGVQKPCNDAFMPRVAVRVLVVEDIRRKVLPFQRCGECLFSDWLIDFEILWLISNFFNVDLELPPYTNLDSTDLRHGQATNKETDTCQNHRWRRQKNPQEHGHSHGRRRSGLKRGAACERCAGNDGTRHSQQTEGEIMIAVEPLSQLTSLCTGT